MSENGLLCSSGAGSRLYDVSVGGPRFMSHRDGANPHVCLLTAEPSKLQDIISKACEHLMFSSGSSD